MKNPLPLLVLLFPSLLFASVNPADIQAFVDDIHKQHGVNKAEVTRLLGEAKLQQEILDRMGGRAEKKSWYQYRPIFMTPERIDKGVEFWRQNRPLLDKAHAEFGVPPEVITAILGVETLYGERTGKMRVLDALYTLAFAYPKRAEFFRKELMQFILLAKEANFDPTQVTGSYAGAMGATQFISSSYRHYAVDYDKDGHTDLWDSKADMIGSIANYFKLNGWQKDGPVAVKAEGVDFTRHAGLMLAEPDRPLKEVIRPEDKPSHPLAKLGQVGIRPATRVSTDSPAYLMAFEVEADLFEYWLGFQNFYAITRYNRSPLYAMAVHQLSQAIRAQYQPPRKEPPFAFH